MSLRFRCLLLDHDDTAVESTAAIHYPAHVEALRILRPGTPAPGLDGWFLRNFHPGLMDYLVGELGMSDEELKREYAIWRSFTTSRAPSFYPGFLDALRAYRARGGLVAVISHSEKDVIEWHYASAGNPRFAPDAVYGWMDDPEKRKPSPWPVRQALELLGCDRKDALIVDDLKPGVLMSHATGVPVAAAGWGHRIPEIEMYMRTHSIAFFSSVEEFRDFIL